MKMQAAGCNICTTPTPYQVNGVWLCHEHAIAVLDNIRYADFFAAYDEAVLDRKDLLDLLEDVVNQACLLDDGILDSMAISAYAEAMRTLAECGRLEIISESGRRVIGQWRLNHV